LFLYYISDRRQFPGSEMDRRRQVLDRIEQAALLNVDFVQLREKDLSAHELELLACAALKRIRVTGSSTRMLINSRTDIALATEADGVHLRSTDISPKEVREIWRESKTNAPIVAVSCHTYDEVIAAEESGADFVAFGPIFEKKGDSSATLTGLDALHAVCQRKISVLALGGVTLENAARCLEAGARGIAGIRLFQEGDLGTTVRALRACFQA
jgi:thiamine-phosphate pyrophosphorylase